MEKKTLGQIGFEAYGDHANWTTYDNKPMPRWDNNLRADIKEKWEVAAEAIKKASVFNNNQHIYLSTYCLHGLHNDCRLTCKHCQSLCVCECHHNDLEQGSSEA